MQSCVQIEPQIHAPAVRVAMSSAFTKENVLIAGHVQLAVLPVGLEPIIGFAIVQLALYRINVHAVDWMIVGVSVTHVMEVPALNVHRKPICSTGNVLKLAPLVITDMETATTIECAENRQPRL